MFINVLGLWCIAPENSSFSLLFSFYLFLSISFHLSLDKLPDISWFYESYVWTVVSQLMVDLSEINWKFKGSTEIRDVKV